MEPMATRKPSKPAERQRDPGREYQGRATKVTTTLFMTPEERAEVDALAATLGAPIKSSVLAAVRAATVALTKGATLGQVREPLKADLSPAKPGPKVAAENDGEA